MQNQDDLQTLQSSLDEKSMATLIQCLTDTRHLYKDVMEQISDAIESKYDVLKDKLLMEALMNQVHKPLC